MTYQYNSFILQDAIHNTVTIHNNQMHDTQYKFTARSKRRRHHTRFNTQSGLVHLSCRPEYRRLSLLLTGEQPVRTSKGLSRVIYYTWATAGRSEMFLQTVICSSLHLKCDGTRAETRFHLLLKQTCPFKSAGVSVQSTTGSQGVRISGSNAGYTMFRGGVRVLATPSIRQFTLHSPPPGHASPCAITFQLDSTFYK